MAHRGRLYPVHFRRDFNQGGDITGSKALAKAYACTLHSGTAPPYIVDNERFECVEIDGPDEHTLAWLSPARVLGIWFWQLRIHVSLWQLPDTQLQPTFILERDAIIVSKWRRIHSSYDQPVTGGNPFAGEVLFTDETTFERGANFNFSSTVALGYPP